MTTLPGWLGTASTGAFCCSLERLDLSDNQLDLRQVALPWQSQPHQLRHGQGPGLALPLPFPLPLPLSPPPLCLSLARSLTVYLDTGGSPCPWSSLRYLSLRGVRTNTVPHFLSSLHLTELDLNYLDIHDRGGGAIALAPPDTAPRDDGDANDAALAYLSPVNISV